LKYLAKRIIILVLIAIIVITAVLYLVSLRGHKKDTSTSLSMNRLIAVDVPKRRDVSIRSRFFGEAQSKDAISVIALAAGWITSIEAEDNKIVKKGDPLFLLGGQLVERRLTEMRAKISSLNNRLSLSKKTVAIDEELVKQKIIQKEELYSEKDALFSLQSDLETAKSDLSSYESSLNIDASISGIFTGRRVSRGQEVEEGDTLAEIIPPNSIRIVATMFPPESVSLKGLNAKIVIDDKKTVLGVISNVLPNKTSGGATIIWIEGGDINKCFTLGETVSGYINISTHKGSLIIKSSAVVRDSEQRTFVFLKTSKGYIKRAVKTGPDLNGWIEISDGIKETDSVVINGAYELYYRDFNRIYKVKD